MRNRKSKYKLKIISVAFSVVLVVAVLISIPLISQNKHLLFKDDVNSVTYKAEAEGDTQNQVSTASYVDGLTLARDENGIWYCSLNGAIYTEYDGIIYYNDAWYYVRNGYLDWEYTGYVNYYGTDYYITGGWLDWSHENNRNK